MPDTYSLIFQSAKLSDKAYILNELEWAKGLLGQNLPIRRVYGVSGGALVALAFALNYAAQKEPERWQSAQDSLDIFSIFLDQARNRNLIR